MKISLLTICPEQFDSFIKTPLISRNISSGLLQLEVIDIRDFAPGSFRKVDDSPYGGGPGMIMRCQPIYDALKEIRTADSHVIIMAPRGTPYKQETAHLLAEYKHLIIICGHYEGIDERVYEAADDIISIGDYILTGGELPAMVVCDSLMRLIEGSMKKESTIEESFEDGLLEYPQYTRPADYNGMKVPEILLSGNREKIAEWRKEKAQELTEKNRPDLLKK
ncbi:MAG: tRNA (guanosine(37)-N1)-methyltransferase TrmD [Erysipelotrichaceae bacterium]|nr:tRNA (guanosine(37)-N1)-methyltransferase TrmD [Erysipelotrichaceae bacterium]